MAFDPRNQFGVKGCKIAARRMGRRAGSVPRVSKRPTHKSAACLRARYCTIVKQRRYFFGPTANRLCADRTYITPSDKAGVAINNSPIELVAMCAYFRPAVMTSISPSSFER